MTLSDASLAATPQVLDSRTLGRPVHLLPLFASRFAADIDDFLRLGPNRRYGTGFEVGAAAMRAAHDAEAATGPWAVFGSPAGRIGLSVPRGLVLRLLRCRYGLQETEDPTPDGLPVTASEERMARKLGLQLAGALVHRIAEGLQPPGAPVAAGQHEADGPDAPAWLSESSMPTGQWRIEIRLVESQRGTDELLRFSLDEGFMRLLLGQLARERASPREAGGAPAEPLASQLKLRLVARLLQQRMALGDILALRVGDVLPIHLHDADVLVKDSRLFTATVAEHKGRLWLTAFNDI